MVKGDILKTVFKFFLVMLEIVQNSPEFAKSTGKTLLKKVLLY